MQRLTERLLQRFARLLVRKEIGGECFQERGPLMIRYMLLRTRWFNLYLHNFLRSDADRHCHDHPWSFWTLILTGGYIEHTLTEAKFKRPGSVLFRPAEWLHWVEVSRPMWTLVLVTRKRREWGFITEKGWLHWARYAGEFPERCD